MDFKVAQNFLIKMVSMLCALKMEIISCYCIHCSRALQQPSGAMLIYLLNGHVTDGFMLREDEFVTSLRTLKEIGLKAGFSAFEDD